MHEGSVWASNMIGMKLPGAERDSEQRNELMLAKGSKVRFRE